MSWCAYFIPFLFVFSPALLMEGSWTTVALTFVKTGLGIFIGTIAVVGYLRAPIGPLWRVAYGVIAAMVLWPLAGGGLALAGAGALLAIAAIAYEVMRGRAPPIAKSAG